MGWLPLCLDIRPKFISGPKLNYGPNYSFTPWIIGGGYTDGVGVHYVAAENAGFMGGLGGHKSGLCGYVGSVKFYSKPLTTEEALINFKAQKGFFKNILV